MRQYGKVLPTPQTNPPAVASATGLGTGGGAGVRAQVGQSGWGHVELITGSNPSANGNVVLSFASAPPTLFVSGDDAFGPLTVTGQGTTTVTISWAGATMPLKARMRINYEWSVSS